MEKILDKSYCEYFLDDDLYRGSYRFITNFMDDDLELYQHAIVGTGGQILQNQPGFPYYNSCPWTLWVQESRIQDFWNQFDLMKSRKKSGIENWMLP